MRKMWINSSFGAKTRHSERSEESNTIKINLS